MSKSNQRHWQTEKALFKDLPQTSCPKRSALIKRREQVALERRHQEHCKNLYL